jgi:hypothetical protein
MQLEHCFGEDVIQETSNATKVNKILQNHQK